MTKPVPPCRLFPIFAREAPVCVIFRRGPSKWTQIIHWNTKTDEITEGQWFKGRIYERRSDLSPDGSKLIYFAQKINSRTLNDTDYTYAWTAISKPPFLTALALWAKGDCWHGGGLFRDDRTVFLNHKPDVAVPHSEHLPKDLQVNPKPEAHGEDGPIYNERLDRDKWKIVQEWNFTYEGWDKFYVTHQPEIREKTFPGNGFSVRMERSLNQFNYREVFEIKYGENVLYKTNDKGSWADFDQNGRLVIFDHGKLFIDKSDSTDSLNLFELANFNENKPEAIEAPEWVERW